MFKLFPTQEQEVEQIFERLDVILRRLSVIVRPEKQVQLPQHHQTQDNLLCQLPSELIYLIAQKLALYDYWKFRATCKMFEAAFPAIPEWRIPLFVSFLGYGEPYELKDPRQTASCSGTIFGHVFDSILASADNGWLLTKRGSLTFVNLYTFKCVYLTGGTHFNNRSIDSYFERGVGFSKHPMSSDCVTVGYCSSVGVQPGSIAYLCSPNGCKWKRCELLETFSEYPTSVIYHKEAFYFIDKNGYVGVFKLVGEQASWRFYGKQVEINEACESSHLVECDGDLLSVFLGDRDGAGIKVFRYNVSTEKWVQVKSLGKYSLFIGPTSFSAAARDQEMRNRIYLPRMKDNSMVYYSLETGKFYVVGGVKPLGKLSSTTTPLHCCWV